MTSLFNPEYLLDPRDDFVRGWIRGLIEIDYARANVRFKVYEYIRTKATQKAGVFSPPLFNGVQPAGIGVK